MVSPLGCVHSRFVAHFRHSRRRDPRYIFFGRSPALVCEVVVVWMPGAPVCTGGDGARPRSTYPDARLLDPEVQAELDIFINDLVTYGSKIKPDVLAMAVKAVNAEGETGAEESDEARATLKRMLTWVPLRAKRARHVRLAHVPWRCRLSAVPCHALLFPAMPPDRIGGGRVACYAPQGRTGRRGPRTWTPSWSRPLMWSSSSSPSRNTQPSSIPRCWRW